MDDLSDLDRAMCLRGARLGGVNARALGSLPGPGPKTRVSLGGSGFLCPENDDASAERFATLLDRAGIAVSETLSWNAYPWYINRAPRAAELEAGVEPLRRLLKLLPSLRVVMLHGVSARTAGDGWPDGILTWYPGSKSCAPITPATRHSSARPRSGQHAWRR